MHEIVKGTMTTNTPNVDANEADQQQKLARYLSFLEHDPENTHLLMDCLQLALSLQAWEQATALIDKGMPSLSDSAQFLGLAGHVFLALKEYDRALTLLTQSLSINPSDAVVLFNTAQCHYYLNQFSVARDILEKNTLLAESFTESYRLLYARLLYQLDDSLAAITQLDLLHSAHEATAESAGLLSLLLFEEGTDNEKAMIMANKSLAKNPKALEALLARTSLHMDLREYDLAFRDIQHALDHYPRCGRAWSSMALIEFNNLKFESARDTAQKAVTYMDDHIGTWHLLGWAHLMLNELPEALIAFQKSYDIDRRFANTHGGLASVYAHMGEIKLANNHIKLADRLDPDGLASVYAKMVLHNKNNKPEEAQRLLAAVKMMPFDASGKTRQQAIDLRIQELSAQNTDKKNIH